MALYNRFSFVQRMPGLYLCICTPGLFKTQLSGLEHASGHKLDSLWPLLFSQLEVGEYAIIIVKEHGLSLRDAILVNDLGVF